MSPSSNAASASPDGARRQPFTIAPPLANMRAMRSFFRRQTTYFVWGFAIALVITIAVDRGLDTLVRYFLIAAAAGVVVSVAIYFLERRFPDRDPLDGR
jgi:hypothetical protein